MRRILQIQSWALENMPRLAEACRDYRSSAPHRFDPVRNHKLQRDLLFDLADVEVMLCYYKNYVKLRQRFGDGAIPLGVCPRGWERRNMCQDAAHEHMKKSHTAVSGSLTRAHAINMSAEAQEAGKAVPVSGRAAANVKKRLSEQHQQDTGILEESTKRRSWGGRLRRVSASEPQAHTAEMIAEGQRKSGGNSVEDPSIVERLDEVNHWYYFC
jgi:hypothetical protein